MIPNWNGMVHFPDCVRSLDAQTFKDFRITVVDNASEDDSVAWLRANAPHVRVIARDANDGFAAAVNDGIRAATAEYVVLLNNDTSAEADWLEQLVTGLDSTDYDFAAALMVFFDQPGVVNTAGDYFSLFRMLGMQRGARRRTSNFKEPRRVLGASGGRQSTGGASSTMSDSTTTVSSCSTRTRTSTCGR